jgi:hypothetical protein
MSMPIVPPAPVRLSTTTDWPSEGEITCAIERARMSLGPPGASGTMSRIGFMG